MKIDNRKPGKPTPQSRFRWLINPGLLQREAVRLIFRKTGRKLLVCSAFPKSASQSMLSLMQETAGTHLKVIKPKMGNGSGHNFISPNGLTQGVSFRKNTMIFGHLPFNNTNFKIIKKYRKNPKCFVLIRPLPDIVMSYKEHIDKFNFGPLDYHIDGVPECNPGWGLLDEKRKYDFIISFILPWYIRFAVSWMEAAKKWPVEFVTFEELTVYPQACILNIMRFLEIDSNLTLDSNFENTKNLPRCNYNKGIGGRGFQLLQREQLGAIEDMILMHGDAFYHSRLGRYLLFGYDGLALNPEQVSLRKNRQLSNNPIFSFFLENSATLPTAA
ncbi:MAG: sulfotransferase domain-containing protein [Desulfobacterales bacterium]